jgi:hypothetical protein
LTIRPAQIIDQIPGSQVAPATASSSGAVTLSDATPEALGVAGSGTAGDVSRSDHVHALPTLSDMGAAWHGHLHRPAASVTLPSNYSLWLARLEVTSGVVVTIESGAVLRLG